MKFVWIIAAAALVLPTVASADFSVSKPKSRATQAPATPPPGHRTQPKARPVRTPPPVVVRPQAPPPPTGIDPAFVNETLQNAGYKTNLTSNPSPGLTTIESSSGNSAWMVSFKECGVDQRCGEMEFYTLWRVSNEANVCFGWMNEVTNDPYGTDGKPTCYTLPNAGNQLHLTLSTKQAPYANTAQLSGERAKSRILAMLGVWTAHIVRLPEAYNYAKMHCPRKSSPCVAVAPVPGNPATRRRTAGATPEN
jgi:hypothetical protein